MNIYNIYFDAFVGNNKQTFVNTLAYNIALKYKEFQSISVFSGNEYRNVILSRF